MVTVLHLEDLLSTMIDHLQSDDPPSNVPGKPKPFLVHRGMVVDWSCQAAKITPVLGMCILGSGYLFSPSYMIYIDYTHAVMAIYQL